MKNGAQSQIANLVSRLISEPCAIHVRPPPDQYQTAPGPTPHQHRIHRVAAKRPSNLQYLRLSVRGLRYGDVGQAFQTAGSGGFPVATAFDPADWKVRVTGRQECLPYSQGRVKATQCDINATPRPVDR